MERLIVGLLLVAALAGCTDEATDVDLNDVSDERIVTEGISVAVNRGAVVGTISSDAGLAIQGARVSLLGTEHFTDSNETGGFRLVDLVPGDHDLQVHADGFEPALAGIKVSEGAVSKVDITLQPRVGLLPTERSHVHELWGGRTEVTLVDIDYDLTQRPSPRGGDTSTDPTGSGWSSMVQDPNLNSDGHPIPILDQEDGSAGIVYPGADRIEVTFDWTVDEDTTKDTLALEYIGPNHPRTTTEPGGPGTTWTIPINQTQVDGGHAKWTAWRFTLRYVNGAYDPTNWDPGLSIGEVRIVIKVFKGEGPGLEPPHEDFWQGNDTLVLRSADKPWSYGGYPTSSRDVFEASPDHIVPPGTTRLQVTFAWRFENAVVPLFGEDYNLMWRTAAQNPFTTTWDDYVIGEGETTGDQTKVYQIDVDDLATDPYYASYSDWSFSPYRPGDESSNSDWSAQNRDRVFTLEIIAFNGSD